MSFYDEDPITLNHETHPKVFKAHEWVQIKREMTAADSIAIQNKLSRVTGSGKDTQVHMNLGDMVLGWNLSKTVVHSGKSTEEPIPFSTQNVPHLRKAVFDLLNTEINRLNQAESEEEQEDFLSDANGHSEESSAPKKLFPLK
jgi:hypothetical protein